MFFASLRRFLIFILLVSGLLPSCANLAAQTTHVQKLSPGLAAHITRGSAATFSCRIYLRDPAAFLHTQKSYTITPTQLEGPYVTLYNITHAALRGLVEDSEILYIDVADRIAQPEAFVQTSDMTVNAITAAQAAYPAVTGAGVLLSIKEDPFDANDIDFKARVVYNSTFGLTSTQHATTMASLAAGGGNSGPQSTGVAPRAMLTASSFARLLPDIADTLVRLGVATQNHSYGVGLENYYGIESQAYDDHCRQLFRVLHVFSAGNAGAQTPTSGTYAGLAGVANLTGQFKLSKNTLSVGELSAAGQVAGISSRGPAHDGRVKPEIVAFGDGGTSEAAALVSGAAVLLQQAYKTANAGLLPHAVLVKALLLNSATDVGRPNVDYETGYGSLNAFAALQTLNENRYRFDSLTQGVTQSFTISVPTNAQAVKVTLVWNDLSAAPGATTALVNDLDLELLDPATLTWLPWVLNPAPNLATLQAPATRGADHLNNVELISLSAPAAGSYTVRIKGTTVTGLQKYAIAYAVQTSVAFTNPSTGTVFEPGSSLRIRWQGITPAAATLEYRTLPAGSWQLIGAGIAAGETQFIWQAPETPGQVEFRITSGSLTATSAPATILARPTLLVGFDCTSQFMLQWQAIPGAAGYQVYRLGAQQLEAVGSAVTDTFILFSKGAQPALLYAVAPLMGAAPGALSYTTNYTTQGVGCYIRQFAATDPVTSTAAELNVELSSLQGLTSFVLQKQVGNSFAMLREVSPVTELLYTFTDDTLLPGGNLYRLQLATTTVGQVTSDTVNVLNTLPGRLVAYPSPALRGQVVQLLTGPANAARIEVYNSTGLRMLASDVEGAIKQFSTEALTRGVYYIRVTDGEGRRFAGRIVVL